MQESLPSELKILVIGDPAAGKTTLAKSLKKGLGIPAFHSDTYRFKNAVTLFPYSEFKDKINSIIVENESYIIEGADFGDDSEFINTILSSADIILHFDIPTYLSINRWFKRIDKTESIEHLGFISDDTYDGGVKQVRFMLEWYHWYLDRKEQMQQKLENFKDKVVTLRNYEDSDKIAAFLTNKKFSKNENGVKFSFT